MPSKAAGSLLLAIVGFGLFQMPSIQAAGITYVYDSLGRLESVLSSDGYTERQIDYTYVGNVLTRSSILATISTNDTADDLRQDTWEQLHGLNPQDPADAMLDSYQDGLTNLEEFFNGTEPRQADAITDGYSGWITYTYDNLGRLESVISSYGFSRRTVIYAYDAVGNLLSRTVSISPGGRGGLGNGKEKGRVSFGGDDVPGAGICCGAVGVGRGLRVEHECWMLWDAAGDRAEQGMQFFDGGWGNVCAYMSAIGELRLLGGSHASGVLWLSVSARMDIPGEFELAGLSRLGGGHVAMEEGCSIL